MAENNLNARVNVSADASPVESLIKVLQKLEKVSAQLANVLPAATEALAEFGGAAEATTEAADNASRAAKNLDKSVGSGQQTKKSTTNLKNYVKTVNDLRAALGKGGPKPVNLFGDNQEAINEIKQLEGELLKLVNVYRTAFGKEEILKDAFDTGSAIQELDELRKRVSDLSEAAQSGRIDFNFKEGSAQLQNFSEILDRVNAGFSERPEFADIALANFADLRQEGNGLVAEIEKIQQEMADIGPKAADGSQEAIQRIGELSRSLQTAQTRAGDLGRELTGAVQQFGRRTGAQNAALQQFGFNTITLDDIFPSQEQQRVAQLQSKIDNAVRQSISEGAVKSALNSFLGLDPALTNVDQNIISITSNLPRLRYALYDVSNTAGIFGAAMLGAATATIKVAAEFERTFADVLRTTEIEAGTKAADNLKDSLVSLSQEIPVSFTQLAEIATLAGQLNISANLIDSFTGTVAKFAATTDVTIDAAATAFGRLNQLVDGVDGQFDKLDSSILAVGINAVATESDIIAISTQIASVANIAGFSASELIGFSSALASVGTRPELARGTFTRLFTEIQQSVADGGEQLNAFARTAGQSVDQFTDAWGAGSGADQVVAILRGLQAEGKNADQVLAQLGITSVRDVPTLLKLAQSVDEVETQIRIANIGFLEGTELQDQYGIITSTLSEKLAVLKNNFTALVETLSGLTLGLTFVVDAAIGLVRVLEAILDNPVNKVFLSIGVVTAGVVGVFSLLGAAVARAGASFAGLLTATIETQEAIAFTTVGIAGLNGSLDNTTASATRAAGAMGNLATATGAVGAQTARTSNDLVGPDGLPIVIADTGKESKKTTGLLRGLGIRLGLVSADSKKTNGNLKNLAAGLGAVGKNSKFLRLIKLGATFTAWGIGLNVVTAIIDYGLKRFGAYGEEVEEVGGKIENFDAYIAAAAKDTEEFNSTIGDARDNFITFEGAVGDTNDEISDYVKLVLATNGELDTLTDYVNGVTGAFERQTLAIGENTKALIRQDLARQLIKASETVGVSAIGASFGAAFTGQEAITGATVQENLAIGSIIAAVSSPEVNQILEDAGFRYQEYVRAIEEGNVDLANSIANEVGPAFESLRNLDPKVLEELGISIEDIDRVVNIGGGGLQRFTDIALVAFDELKKQNVSDILSGKAFEDYADAAEVSAEDLKSAFDEIVEAQFGVANGQNALADSLESFGSVIANEGGEAAATSEELQRVLENIWATSDNGYEAALTMGGFFNGIVDGGYVAGESLVELQGTITETFRTFARQQVAVLQLSKAGTQVMLNGIRVGRSASGKEMAAIDKQIAEIEAAVNSFDALLAIAPEFDITPIERGFKKTGSAAKQAAEEVEEVTEQVRTLLDYGSDLESVFSRAFDLRFARGSALDDLTEAWESFTEQVQNATESLEELQATQQDLAADRAIKEYFLSVAEAYDDQLRAAKLRAEIADLDREQADAARELAEAQETAAGATSLTGQGPGARQNRQALLGLVRNYQDYITVLAESGAGQDELRKATEDARKEFIKQATELGFAESEVLMYAEAFDDVRTAIDRVPRDVTIDFNADPALQALNELNAKLDQSIQKAKELNSQTGSGSIAPVDTAKIARGAAIRQEIETKTERLYGPGISLGAAVGLSGQITALQEKLASGNYATGGFTGRGGRMDPAGIVHRGEYVIPKQYVNQSTGLPDPNFLAQLQNGMRSFAQGGFVGSGSVTDGPMMVELSPYDRKLLENAGNVQLRVDGKVVASATNRSNFNEARRGSN